MTTELTILYVFIELLGVISAVHAVVHVRTAQGTIAWISFLITIPLISVPFYWTFGPKKFHRYSEALQEVEQRHRLALKQDLQKIEDYTTILNGPLQGTQILLEAIAGFPLTGSNQVSLLIDGPETMHEMFLAMEDAKNYILLEYYIVRDDKVGLQLKDLLIKKVQAGVRVHFLYDQIGSFTLSQTYLDDLTNAGIEIEGFRSNKGILSRFQINFRNHRKITVVDGKIGFVGGLNIGNEYLGEDNYIGHWRDTNIKVEGPATLGIQAAFAKDWYWATERVPALHWTPHPHKTGTAACLAVATGPISDIENCTILFHHAIGSARKRIWIASPYFVPDEGIVHALKAAALRGVDVRILLPMKSDHWLVHMAGLTYLEAILLAGAKILRYQPGFLHQKVFLVDDSWGCVGTANLDNRSFRLNFEIGVSIFDRDFLRKLEEMLKKDIEACTEVTLAEISEISSFQWFLAHFSRLFAPIL